MKDRLHPWNSSSGLRLIKDMPEEPNEKDFSGDQWKEDQARKYYEDALTKAKDESAAPLVINQEEVKQFIHNDFIRKGEQSYFHAGLPIDRIYQLPADQYEVNETKLFEHSICFITPVEKK